MGLQSGFDARTDRALRPDHPLLPRDDWRALLEAAGFEETAIPIAGGTLIDRLGFDLILARSPAQADQSANADYTVVEPQMLREWLSARLPGYMVPRHLGLIDRLPLSANGKVDRSALHLPKADGNGRDESSGPLHRQVAELVASCLGAVRVDAGKTLFELGATSLSLVALQRQIGERFGRSIPLQAIFEQPTVDNLVRIIAGGEAPTSPLVRFAPRREDDRRPTLIMMPGIFALPFYLRDLAELLADDVDLLSVQLPGLFADETPLDNIDAQVDYVIARIRQAQPRGPYLIGGHSYGGTVAYETARRLRTAGEEVPLLLLGDTVRTTTGLEAFQGDEIAFTAMVRGLLALYGEHLNFDETILQAMPAKDAYEQLTDALGKQGILGPMALPADRMAAMFKANFQALGRFDAEPLPGDLALIRTEDGFPAEFHDYEPATSLDDPGLGWSGLVEGDLEILPIPGDHLSMMASETLQPTADIIRRLVLEAVTRAQSEAVLAKAG